MIIRKFLGLYETLPYSAITYRLMQAFVIIRLIILLPIFMICSLLWPFYFGYRLWRHVAEGEPFSPETSAYIPFGVQGGLTLNFIFFVGLYIGVPLLTFKNSNDAGGQEFAQPYHNPQQTTGTTLPHTTDNSYSPSSFGIKYEKSLLRGAHSNQADLYMDNIDGYNDDPEDEIRYPPEIYDASSD